MDESRASRLLRAFDDVPALVALVSGPRHVYEFANRSYLAALGAADVVGRPFGVADVEVIDDPLVAELDRVRATGAPFRRHAMHVRVHRPGSDALVDAFFDVRFEPVLGRDGAVESVLIQSTDVTETVLVTRRLEAQRALTRTVLDHSPVVLLAVDPQGQVALAEGRDLPLLGWRAGESSGATFFERFADVPELAEAMRRALAGEAITAVTNVRGSTFDARYGPLRDADGRVTGAVLVGVNVTEGKRLEAQLLQAQKLESLGVLAGGVAHDFNNLLTGVLGGATTAQLHLASGHPATASLDAVVCAARQAAQLTRQLLAYAGKARAEVRPVDLSAYVGDLGGLLRTMVPKKVDLRFDLAPDLPAVEADVAQLQQIVVNLVVNGAEAIGGARGAVRVTTGVHVAGATPDEDTIAGALVPGGRYVVLEVSDTGAGIDAATRSKIFDPFFTTKFTGRGLGLAAVLGIVRGHDGAIVLRSTPGRGATFRVLFPASARPRPAPEPSSELAIAGEGRRVLVIDDDAGVRRIARALLEVFGFAVLEAPDGLAGVDEALRRSGELAAVLLDLTMPEMSGDEVLRALAAAQSRVPVVLMSGYDELETTRRLGSAGFAAFLRKPFGSKDLAAALRAALRR